MSYFTSQFTRPSDLTVLEWAKSPKQERQYALKCLL